MTDRTVNHAIIHLTDTHFPSSADEPPWVDPLIKTFVKLAKDKRIQIVGLAVTGDLVDSPNAERFGAVYSFLKRAATALELVKPEPAPKSSEPEEPATNGAGEAAENKAKVIVDWDRVWIVDGNHDYRRFFGLIETNSLGIQKGEHFKRFRRYPVEGNVGPILVLGMNSSDEGSAARGRVRLDGLRAVQDLADNAGDGFKYRVALVHHHLLPLPDRPKEFDDTKIKKLKRKIYDESTKLLSDAGLVTDILLRSSIDLVLHGHEHKQFAASVRYPDRAGQIMSVVGGPAARDGFQVVTFATSGDVELARYKVGTADYEKDASFLLWSYEDWKRVSWERLRLKQGYFRKAVRRSKLSETGDFRQSSDVSEIFGGENEIKEVEISSATGNSKSGVVAIVGVHNKLTSTDVSAADLKAPDEKSEYTFKLARAATMQTAHPGYKAFRFSSDNFVLTQEEMKDAKRGDDGNFTEFTRFHYPCPVEQLRLTLDFPPGFAPEAVKTKVSVRLDGKTDGPTDVAETLRMDRNIFYDAKRGQVWLSLDWVAPHHQYEIRWDLPSLADVDAKNRDTAVLGTNYLNKCLALPSSLTPAFNGFLTTLRDKCFERIRLDANLAEAEAAVFQPHLDTLSIWAFDKVSGESRPVAGTYERGSPFWDARLPWAAGIRGRTIRRRTVEYYHRSTSGSTNFYRKLEKCDQETYLLCVPIFLPPPPKEDKEALSRIKRTGVCRMVAALASTRENSLLHHLRENVALRETIADLIFFEICDFVRAI